MPFVKDNIDILILSETKLDSSFPHAQFSIEGFSKPYRLDRDRNGEELILFVREGFPSKLLRSKFNSGNKEYCLVEINLWKRKWLIVSLYNPHKTTISNYLKDIEKKIETLSSQYEIIILLGDFDFELRKEPTYFKNPEKPTIIDLILTDKPKTFSTFMYL